MWYNKRTLETVVESIISHFLYERRTDDRSKRLLQCKVKNNIYAR